LLVLHGVSGDAFAYSSDITGSRIGQPEVVTRMQNVTRNAAKCAVVRNTMAEYVNFSPATCFYRRKLNRDAKNYFVRKIWGCHSTPWPWLRWRQVWSTHKIS